MTTQPVNEDAQRPLADPVSEARRLVERADRDGVTARLLGGAAVCLQAPGGAPILKRVVNDIDVVTPKGIGPAIGDVLARSGYVGEDMFNALHGARRQVYVDPVNDRKLDVFVGSFSMCHAIPIAARLDRDPLTVPLAELLLTKLQIVQLTERDEHDIYNLTYHHELDGEAGAGIETPVIADLCARDWGLWRTCRQTIERCRADVDRQGLSAEAQRIISERLTRLWDRVESTPKSRGWRIRSRVGERVRWFHEPEEVETGH